MFCSVLFYSHQAFLRSFLRSNLAYFLFSFPQVKTTNQRMSRLIVGCPAGMESDEGEEEFTTPTEGRKQIDDASFNGENVHIENGDGLNGHARAVNGDLFGGEEKVAPEDDLEGHFDNGMPIDETLQLNKDKDVKQDFGFKNINEILDQKNDRGGLDSINRRVSFNEPPQDGGGKRRRVENETLPENDGVIMQRAFEKPSAYSGTRGFDAFRFKTESFAEMREDLETVLHAASMQDLLHLFRTHGIGLKEFLIMNDLDFEKLGVTQIGDRKRLVQLVADIHTKPWSEKSLIEPGPNFSVAEAVKMISNIHGHMVCMESSLYYLRQIADQKNLLPSDLGNFNKLMRELDATASSVPMFEKRLRELRKSLQRMSGILIEAKAPADFIDVDTKLRKRDAAIDRMKKVGLFIAVPVALYVIYRKVIKN